MRNKLPVVVLLTLVIALAAAALAQDATPPLSTSPATTSAATNPFAKVAAKTVTAIVVKSWGDNPVWGDLTSNWSTYGKTPVSVDDKTLINSDFTYQDLVNSKANVIILSDVAGGNQVYSSAEFAAVAKYAKKGHPVLATYAAFQNGSTDDRGLAPVFGLSSKLDYTFLAISGDFKKITKPCLLGKIKGNSWQSNGFNYSQVPSSGSWKKNLGKSKAVADSDAFVGVISLYTTKTYTGIYVSNMPEYQNVGGDDEQLLYNAITCYVKK